MRLRDLITDAVAPVPHVAPERCVHTHAEVASCDRCVDCCPLDAWVLEDDALYIDSARCDGCGLCAAHCPEGALVQAEAVLPREITARVSAACVRAGCGEGPARIPCVNAIGFSQIATLYRAGVTQLSIAVGDCRHCTRVDGDAFRLRVNLFNRVLHDRGLPELQVHLHAAGEPASIEADATALVQGAQLSRRGFFRRLAGAMVEPIPVGGEQEWQPPGVELPTFGIGDVALFVPSIDVVRCNGCDACVRVCPHGALLFTTEPDGYRIDSNSCTGCGLCDDICDQDAVTVATGATVEQAWVPLHKYRCAQCGAVFHTTSAQPSARPTCRICHRVDHQRKLFQIIASP